MIESNCERLGVLQYDSMSSTVEFIFTIRKSLIFRLFPDTDNLSDVYDDSFVFFHLFC